MKEIKFSLSVAHLHEVLHRPLHLSRFTEGSASSEDLTELELFHSLDLNIRQIKLCVCVCVCVCVCTCSYA